MIPPKNHFIFLGVFFILLDIGCNVSLKPNSKSSVVFENANIIQMKDESILEKHSLLISDGIIERIEPSSSFKIPMEAKVINASGKYLIPGLSDMHVHLKGDAWNIMYPTE